MRNMYGLWVYMCSMFTGSHKPPPASETAARTTVGAEIRYIIRRLARHPSIIFWSGCNECGGGAGEISDFALPIVAAEDKTRPVWPASPVRC